MAEPTEERLRHARPTRSEPTGAIVTPISDLLTALADRGEPVRVGAILSEVGARAHGLGILLFALPESLPVPVVGTSTVLAIPIIILSGHLLLFGGSAGIPRRVEQAELPPTALRLAAKYAAPVLRLLETVSRPRLHWIARRQRLVALFCLVLGVVLALPIPLGNLLPASCLILLAMGMIQRDGAFVIAALCLAGISAAALYFGTGAIMSALGWR